MRWIAFFLFIIVIVTMFGCATPTSSIESGINVDDVTRPDRMAAHVTWKVESRF